MSFSPESTVVPTKTRRTTKSFWTLLILAFAIGGMALSAPGLLSSDVARAPAHSGLAPSLLLWNPLTITDYSASPSPGFLGNVTTISVTATGGLPFNVSGVLGYGYSYAGLPPGCTSANSSSILCTPTPTAVGNYTVVVTVTDAGGNVTKNAIALEIDAMTITSFQESVTTVALGGSTFLWSTYAGAVGAITWTWAGLPTGCLTNNVSSMLCTPTQAGTFQVSLTATDSTGASNTVSTTFVVTPVDVSAFTATPSTIYTGQTTTLKVTTTGTTSAVSFSYSGLPTSSPGCVSANSATLSCLSRVKGTFSITVTATDSASDVSHATLTLTVLPLTIVSFTATPHPTYEFTPTTYTVVAHGYEGVVVSGVPTAGYPIYSYAGLPTGCTSTNVSSFTCSATEEGTFTVTATVSDPTLNTTSATLTLLINPAVELNVYTQMDSAVEALPQSASICAYTNNDPFYSTTCSPQAQDPSVVGFANGTVGLGYEIYTNQTSNTCTGASSHTSVRVAFGLSTNNGTTFYHTVGLGGVTCQYLNAIEPSFAANAAGDVYGVFILENASGPPNEYGVRTSDALAFVSSVDGGYTFSAVTILDSSGNLARPAIAVSGSDVYVVYENIANSSTAIPGGVLPISLKFVASTTGGTSWSTAVTLPGENKTSDWNAMSPSIAVNAAGEVAIAYATDRSCVAKVGATCLHYGSQIVVITSITNGVSWSGPSVASLGILSNPAANQTSSFLGESTCYAGVCQSYFFQSSPSTSVAFNPSGSKLYVAWSGTINNTASLLTGSWWRWSAVGVSGTANNGASWTGGVVAAPNWARGLGASAATGNRSNYYSPAIGLTGSELYLTYSEDNETNTSSGIGALYPGPWDNSLSQWGDNAAVASLGTSAALTWGSASPISWTIVPAGRLTNFTGNSFEGYGASVAISSTGVPILGFALAQDPTSTIVSNPGYYAQNTTLETSLIVAALAQPQFSQVIGLTLVLSGLPAGSTWTAEFDYQLVTSNATALLVVNVPEGVTIFQKLFPVGGYGVQVTAPNLAASEVYYGPTTLTLTYSILYYYNESVAPNYQASSCTSSYCYDEYGTFNYLYECIPVAGYTCDSAPAVATPDGYSTVCNNYGQVGCFYLDSDSFFYNYVSGSINEWEYSTYEDLFGYTSNGYQSVYFDTYCYNFNGGSGCPNGAYPSSTVCGASSPLPSIGVSCTPEWRAGFWLPHGFTITAGEEYYDLYGFGSGAPSIPNYFNGTGNGAYNGTLQTGSQYGCFTGGYYGTYCPYGYYLYYYYAIYDPYECQYILNYCEGSGPITMNSPINETEWNLPGATSAGGGYPVEVQPQGLPTGTPYKFEFGTTQYSAKSPDPVLIPSVAAGLVQLTGASAPGSTPGWEYYASPVTVIVPQDVIVNLTFSTQVNLTAPARTVSIHALNLTTGLPWTAEFNGTIYSQSVPWLNVSERPGLYGLTSWSVNSTTGNAQYAPVNPSSVNFEKQTEYNFSFEPSYRVATTASSGGTVQLGTGKAGSGASAFYKSGATVTVTATPAAGDEFLGFTGTGVGSYTGNGTHVGSQYTATVTANGPIQEGASFGLQPATRYNITFVSKDLPSGVWWTVSLDGLQYSTAASTLTVTGLYVHNAPGGIGTYKFAVGYAYENGTNGTRYIPGGFPSTVWANATGVTTYRIVWATQYEVTLASTAGGSVTGSAGTARVAAGSFWESANATVAAIATKQSGYRFLGWNGTGTGSVTSTATSIQFQVTGSVTEVALFEQIPYHIPPQYVVDFVMTTPVLPGTTWTLTVSNSTNSWQFSSDTTSLNATGLNNGTYTLKTSIAYAPDGLTRYAAVAPPATVSVAGQNTTQRLSYSTEYWVSIEASTLGTVTVTQGASNAAASLSGWYTARTVLVLNATATGNNLFVGWVGNGSASYTGSQSSQTLTLTGPVREVAEFEPPAPATKQTGGFFSTAPSWGILAAVGFVVGLLLGIVVFRRRKAGGSGMTRETDQSSPQLYGDTSAPDMNDSPGADQ